MMRPPHNPKVACVRCGSPHTPRRAAKSGQNQVCLNSKACRERQERRRRDRVRVG